MTLSSPGFFFKTQIPDFRSRAFRRTLTMAAATRRVIGECDLPRNVLKLPRLPIPSLTDTAKRYSRAMQPLKQPHRVEQHVDLFNRFCQGSGPAMQAALVATDAAAAAKGAYPHSYIEQIWDDGYLCFRGPSPVNIAPAFCMKPITDKTQNGVAAAFLFRALRFAEKIRTGKLDVDGQVDVSQLAHQFGFSRVPQPQRDCLVRSGLLEGTRCAVVMCNGYIYKLNLFDPRHDAFSEATLEKALDGIRQHADNRSMASEFPLGVLTAGARSDWASAYEELVKGGDSAACMATIQQALIVVCLDNATWSSPTDLVRGMLVGDPTSQHNANIPGGGITDKYNRWYDKHQIIIDRQGRLAGNFEHAFSDGMSWSRWMNEIYCDMCHVPSGWDPMPSLTVATVRDDEQIFAPIDINVRPDMKDTIKASMRAMDRLASSVQLSSVCLPFGKKHAKESWKISPDAFAQLSFHLAYMNMHSGKMAPTYESCSTAGFWHGRTETIRTATLEVHSVCKAAFKELFGGRNTNERTINEAAAVNLTTGQRDALRRLIVAAAQRHVELAKEAAVGQGVDRHLLALKEVVKQKKDPQGLAFFNDTLYEYGGTWLMSTSNVSQPFMDWFNFGPVTGDGYGLGYNIMDDKIHVGTSSLTASSRTSASELAAQVGGAAAFLSSVLTSSS